MKVAEMRAMQSAELHVELERLRRHLFDLRAQAVTEKLENPHQLRQTRTEIARVLTILSARVEPGAEEKPRRRAAQARSAGT